jgi:hypothetical protein
LKTQQTPAVPSVNVWLQRLFLIVTGLLSIASVQLFALAERTDQYVSWTIAPPLMAAFHDAGYWGGGTVLLLLASRERVWTQVRVVTSAAVTFTLLMLLTTWLAVDRFHLRNAMGLPLLAAWAWMVVSVVVSPLLVGLLLWQDRMQGLDLPRRAPLSLAARIVLGFQIGAMLVVGLTCFLAPQAVMAGWPWKLTPLTEQVVGIGLVALGGGGMLALWGCDWQRLQIASIGFAVVAGLELLALTRSLEAIDWNRLTTRLYFLFVLSVLVAGLLGCRLPCKQREARRGE